jgi:GT2 family glycosyltransferase
MTPLVSVIVPCFNQARFLPDAIASLRAQSLQNWEAIVVDDGSPDDTADTAAALAACDDRVRLIRKPNGGLSSARNAGLAEARGDYIQFLDADDRIGAHKLMRHSSMLQVQTDLDVVFGDARYFLDADPLQRLRAKPPGPGRMKADWTRKLAHGSAPMLHKLLKDNQFVVCAALCRRSVFDAVGVFDERLKRLEDWEFWIRCAARGLRFQYLDAPEADARVRLHASSLSANLQAMQRAQLPLALAALHYLPGPAPRRSASLLATDGLQTLDGAEAGEAIQSLLAVAGDSGAARWLRVYGTIVRRVPGPPRVRRWAYRVSRLIAKSLA